MISHNGAFTLFLSKFKEITEKAGKIRARGWSAAIWKTMSHT